MGRQSVFITGISSGFGQTIAIYLAEKGFRVYGISRRVPESAELMERISGHYCVDVTDEQAVCQCVADLEAAAGGIDIVINNAGIGYGGSLEETTLPELKQMFDVNFFGAVNVCRAVLPGMRERGKGLIINMSSLAGRLGLPFQGGYSATKFALEGYSEALRAELIPFGISVCLVEPGDFQTNFTANRKIAGEYAPGSPYAPYHEQAIRQIEMDEQGGSAPSALAELVEQIITQGEPKLRYVAGEGAQAILDGKAEASDEDFCSFVANYYMKLSGE